MSQTVLILGGNGKIGSHAADAFWNAGWRVRHYDRSTNDMTAAAMGADVIVNGLNPPLYRDWARNIPMITDQVIAAAKASGATVILPGNVYNFGRHEGEMNETTPQAAHTRKGRIRIAMEDAYRASGVQTIVLRAGNFIDPNGNGDIMSMLIMRAAASKKLTSPGNADAMQAYAYVPDWARAARMLAEKRDSLSSFEDIAFPGHSFTLNQLKSQVEATTGMAFKVTSFPWWAVRLASPFVELAREMLEMRYLYSLNHWLGAGKFDELLPDFRPTPLADVMCVGLPADINPDQSVRSSGKAVAAE
ncbi:Nucleoside-diphosphate-sugar epimerase [Cognatiyoonia koreensis]|uniref:Nucleoside-diphosphate-sugar epimerase n=2 Tax=Cognatiyoonia koreensis TaxID=364200 RepID=A0A1I0RYP4_9RHOB|nr:Nucleoside-diphosphate-sugar epimerase [Cognatiyoonia koreensis]